MSDIQQWRAALRSSDLEERATAAESLCHAGPEAAPAILELVQACADDETVSEWAAAALEEFGPPPAEFRDPLTRIAATGAASSVYWAVTMLGRLGPAGIASEQAIVSLLQDSPDAAVQERAAWALGEMGAKSAAALTALNDALNAPSPRLARLAKASLEQIQK
jgi:HEAT repeat protein